jgi:hypothetical protein
MLSQPTLFERGLSNKGRAAVRNDGSVSVYLYEALNFGGNSTKRTLLLLLLLRHTGGAAMVD